MFRISLSLLFGISLFDLNIPRYFIRPFIYIPLLQEIQAGQEVHLLLVCLVRQEILAGLRHLGTL